MPPKKPKAKNPRLVKSKGKAKAKLAKVDEPDSDSDGATPPEPAAPIPDPEPEDQDKQENEWDKKRNIVLHLNALLYNQINDIQFHMREAKKSVIKSYLSRFEVFDTSSFSKRVTAISWNQNESEPYTLGAGDKYGNLLVLKGVGSEAGTRTFSPVFQKDGAGVGATILSLKFQTNEDLMVAGISGVVAKMNMTRNEVQTFYDTQNYEHWFTSMDVSNKSNTVVAGDTKGDCHLFSAHGEIVGKHRLHKGKILHCEYNTRMPHLLATAGLDRKVKLFDLRKFNPENCLDTFVHNHPINIATFSPGQGSRLLTSDQKDEIRVYQGPLWNHSLTIKHPHRHFQHLTPIKASWHPLNETIIIGTFPSGSNETPRPVQFLDPDTGALVHELDSPKGLIMSLNEVNRLGDVLASTSSGHMYLWDTRKQDLEIVPRVGSLVTSSALRNALRGEGEAATTSRSVKRRRDPDEDDDDIKKQKAAKSAKSKVKAKPRKK